jgi:predicted short-subunit dehydrogenase-like oxidoreductase (DUF2520 family)
VPGCAALARPQAVAEASEIVFLTVPDDAIAAVAASVRWRQGQVVVHCSGATPLEALAPARAQGAQVGAFHPLQTFADPQQALDALPGTAFAVEADPPVREELDALVRALGGWPIALGPQDRVLYHVSAVSACGFVVTLVKRAADLWSGFPSGAGRPEEGLRALLPLVRATVDSLAQAGAAGALTGPFVRGDTGTVQRHLEALSLQAPEYLHLYCHLALAELPLARAKGSLSRERETELRRLLEEALTRSEGHGAATGAGVPGPRG